MSDGSSDDCLPSGRRVSERLKRRKTLDDGRSPPQPEEGVTEEWIQQIAQGFPIGWIQQIRLRESKDRVRRDMLYIDPVTGYTFQSLRDARHYVTTGDTGKFAVKPKEEGSSFPELPTGWITKINPRKTKTRVKKDMQNYINPVSGYTFLSMKNVRSFLATGEIGRLTIKPKEVEFENESSNLENVDGLRRSKRLQYESKWKKDAIPKKSCLKKLVQTPKPRKSLEWKIPIEEGPCA